MQYALLNITSSTIAALISDKKLPNLKIEINPDNYTITTLDSPASRARVMVEAAYDMRASGIDISPDDIEIIFIPSIISMSKTDGEHAFASHHDDSNPIPALDRIINGLDQLGISTIYIGSDDPEYLKIIKS